MKDVLVITSGIIHPSFLSRFALTGFLKELTGFQFHFSTATDDLRLLQKKNFSSLILFLHRSRLSQQSVKALSLFLMKGGGLLAFHTSSTCFSSHPDLWEMIGGRYLFHRPVSEFKVTPKKEDNSVFADISGFLVKDSLPIHELEFGVTTHFEAHLQNATVPVIWSKEYYLGKVLYCCLGHTTASLKSKEVKEVIARGLIWIDPAIDE